MSTRTPLARFLRPTYVALLPILALLGGGSAFAAPATTPSPVPGRPPYAGGNDSSTAVTPIDEFREPAGPVDSTVYGKVAVVQWNPAGVTPLGVTPERAEAYKAGNRQALEQRVREAAAQGAKMVITSEFAIVGYPDIPELPPADDQFRNREDIRPYVEPFDGASTVHFSAVARELGIYLHFGFAEVDRATDRYYNTVVAVDPRGRVVAKYRKMSLFALETNFLSAGAEPVIYESVFGKIGLAICSDIYYGRTMTAYRNAGVAAIALSTSWAQYNTGILSYQRGAQWTNAYVLAANQDYFPDSGVINPDGSRQSHVRQSSGIAYGYLPYVASP